MNEALRQRAVDEFEASWMRHTVRDEIKAELIKSLIYLRLAGEKPTLAGAATDACVSAGTARSWKARDQSFAVAISTAIGAKTDRPPAVQEVTRAVENDAAALRAEADRWKKAYQYESRRARAGRYSDPRRAQRQWEMAEARANAAVSP